jgi:hypothetical protein
MAQHVLSLEVPETMNPCLFLVADSSVYNPDVDVKCPVLEITLPGFTVPVQFGEDKISPGFNEVLTACDFEIQVDGCGTTFNNLPDGIWIIKYSVSPNDQVYVEYNHLRMIGALTRYNSILCELDLGTCDPDRELKAKMDKLREIRMYLDAAKAKVEFCHEPAKGMELYKYAIKLLDKFECKSCVNL